MNYKQRQTTIKLSAKHRLQSASFCTGSAKCEYYIQLKNLTGNEDVDVYAVDENAEK